MPVISTADDWARLVAELKRQLRPDSRYMLGIVGVPGAGKSTVAHRLAHAIPNSIVVPMDGFHLPNTILDERGLRALKGIPATFDGQGFVDLLHQIRQQTDQAVYCPAFDRLIDGSIADAIEVKPNHQLVIVEGNYLLLNDPPWRNIRSFLDGSWYLEADETLIHQRLLARHIAGGRNISETEAKIASTDAPNAELIRQSKTRADLVIEMRWQIE